MCCLFLDTAAADFSWTFIVWLFWKWLCNFASAWNLWHAFWVACVNTDCWWFVRSWTSGVLTPSRFLWTWFTLYSFMESFRRSCESRAGMNSQWAISVVWDLWFLCEAAVLQTGLWSDDVAQGQGKEAWETGKVWNMLYRSLLWLKWLFILLLITSCLHIGMSHFMSISLKKEFTRFCKWLLGI